MNIFVLDIDPKKAAEYHCDKHVVKMITETAQILSTVLNINDINLYKSTHINHPCTKWAKESKENFEWLLELGINLGYEYTKRYNKIHKASLTNDYIKSIYNKHINNSNKLTQFVLAMPEIYKSEDPIQSYRNYYIGEKYKFAKWKLGNIPYWWK